MEPEVKGTKLNSRHYRKKNRIGKSDFKFSNNCMLKLNNLGKI